MITNTKKQRLKIYSRDKTVKNTILKIQNKINHKNYKKYICEICFNKCLFYKVIVGYKNENLRSNKALKNDNSKNVSRNFSGVVEGTVGSVQSDSSLFQFVLFLKVYRPLPMLS